MVETRDIEKQAGPASEADGAETMESLLAEQNEFHAKLQKREVVWVKIVQVQKESVLVDIGEKNEGVIPVSDFPEDQLPQAGRRVPAVLVKKGRGDQSTMLSTSKAKAAIGWEQAAKAFAAKERVRGRVSSVVKGGFLVNVGGVSGFMPASHSDLRPVRKPAAMVGTGVRCYILELNRAKNQLILSRRAVLEEDAKKRKAKLLGELQVGKVRIGRINRVGEHGLLVDVGGAEGLVHTADIAWKDSAGAKKRYSRGQKIRVKVLKIDQEKSRISLGLKQLTPHPADALRKRYKVKSTVKGKVVEVAKDGVRITLVKGDIAFCSLIELVHEKEMVEDRGAFRERGPRRKKEDLEKIPRIWPKIGEALSAIVLGIDNAKMELSVSIRRFESIQDRKHVAKYLKPSPRPTLGQLLNPDE